MSAIVSIDLRESELEANSEDHQLQFLPAKIGFQGKANVQTYLTDFISTTTIKEPGQHEEGDGTTTSSSYTASFRGRPLDGRTVKTPKGYSAFVIEGGGGSSGHRAAAGTLHDDGGGDEEVGKEIKMRAAGRFDRITVWNYDKPDGHPQDNPVSKAFQWLDIANIVAGCDDDGDDVAAEKENSLLADNNEGTPTPAANGKKRKRSD